MFLPRSGASSLTAGRGSATAVALLIFAAALQFSVPTATAKERTFVIEMRGGPFRFVPDLLQVDPGDVVTVVVYNNDTVGHTFDLPPPFSLELGTTAAPMQPGTSRTATFTASSQGVFWFFCAISPHATARGDGSYTGMAGRLVVGQPTPGPDLTVAFVVIGVIATAGVGVGLLLWSRRRAPKS